MNRNYTYKLISSILVMSFVITPFLIVTSHKAEAQSVSGYLGGLAPVIAKLPQCYAVIGSKIKGLFSNVSGLLASQRSFENYPGEFSNTDIEGAKNLDNELENTLDYDAIAKKNVEELAAEELAGLYSVKVNISDTPEGKAIRDINDKTTKIDKSVDSLNANSTCIQSIGRLVIKMILQKTTVSMINWINSGFDGKPAFVQDFGKFFGDIAKNEILQFGVEINDPERFPFGKAWLKNFTSSYERKFRDNAEYSLDRLIKKTTPEYSADGFLVDFSQGGWNAWLALTQYPGNNPWDFKVNADNEIQKRLTGTSLSYAENVREALQAANGFLGDERCVEPRGITRTQHDEALARGKRDSSGDIIGACSEWEYVTPGKLVSEAATNAFNYPQNAWLNVEDLNDAIAAMLDALINKFYPNLVEKGFAYFEDTDIGGNFMSNDNSPNIPRRTRTEQDFTPIHLATSWLTDNPEFDIRKDLTQALVDEQRTYIDKLQAQNKELLSTTDGQTYVLNSTTGTSNAYGLLPVIYQLDYCIPGPHPGYEEDTRNTLSKVSNAITSETRESLKHRDENEIVAGIKSVADSVLTNALGPIHPVNLWRKLISSITGKDEDFKVRIYYSGHFSKITGYLPDFADDNDDRVGNILNKQGVSGVLDVILDRYIDIMNRTYFSSPEILPSVANEAALPFSQSRGYNQILKSNEERIASLTTTISLLNEIKTNVDSLNDDLEAGIINETKYEEKLKSQINAFGRISANMGNGKDIANADNILKQIIDKKEYLYKNLLKGPFGCEADLMKPQKNFPASSKDNIGDTADWSTFNANSVKRMPYTLPILYDYHSFNKDAVLPNPAEDLNITLTSTEKADFIKRKIPSENKYDTYGPGFLSFVYFSTENAGNSNRRGSERLKVHDLLPVSGAQHSRYRSVGVLKEQSFSDECSTCAGLFESSIEIY